MTHESKAVDLGFVGEPEKINPEVLRTFIKSNLIPVIAPVGAGRRGGVPDHRADCRRTWPVARGQGQEHDQRGDRA